MDLGRGVESIRRRWSRCQREGRSYRRSPRRRGTIAAWIGFAAALGTGMGLLLWTQKVAGAKSGNAAIIKVERQAREVIQKIATGDFEQKPDEEHSQTDGDGYVRRAALRSIPYPALPSPPLPSRVLPEPSPRSDQGAPDQQDHVLPGPPVPSKIPPGPHGHCLLCTGFRSISQFQRCHG
jgi:hypothetical protein